MRGIPKTPVVCIDCNRLNGCATDQLCHSCRLQRRSPQNKRFHWTPELDEKLRHAYQRAQTKADLTCNLDLIQRSCGFTRVVILNRAAALGLVYCRRRPWTKEEIGILGEYAGISSVGALAKKIDRTPASVKAKLKQLEISFRVREGYTKEDLRLLLRVGAKSIRNWVSRGWLRVVNGRFPESAVAKFLHQHPDQYQLSRVEEAWFKGLIFPAFNRVPRSRVNSRIARISVGTMLDSNRAQLCEDDLRSLDDVPQSSQSSDCSLYFDAFQETDGLHHRTCKT